MAEGRRQQTGPLRRDGIIHVATDRAARTQHDLHRGVAGRANHMGTGLDTATSRSRDSLTPRGSAGTLAQPSSLAFVPDPRKENGARLASYG